jgi:hypothetical protein
VAYYLSQWAKYSNFELHHRHWCICLICMVLAHPHFHCFHQDYFWVANAVEVVLHAGLTNVRFFNVLLLPKQVLFKDPQHNPMSSAFNCFLYQQHCDIPFHCHTAGHHLWLNYCWPCWTILVTVVWSRFAMCWHPKITKFCARSGNLQFSLWTNFEIKITSSGVVAPIISSIRRKDSSISQFTCVSLANCPNE